MSYISIISSYIIAFISKSCLLKIYTILTSSKHHSTRVRSYIINPEWITDLADYHKSDNILISDSNTDYFPLRVWWDVYSSHFHIHYRSDIRLRSPQGYQNTDISALYWCIPASCVKKLMLFLIEKESIQTSMYALFAFSVWYKCCVWSIVFLYMILDFQNTRSKYFDCGLGCSNILFSFLQLLVPRSHDVVI